MAERETPGGQRQHAQRSGSGAREEPRIRASDHERDAVMRRLQDAFASGRLGDAEFDTRMHAALGARTRPELAGLLADLPKAAVLPPLAGAAAPRPGRFAVAIRSSVRRAGRWRVPRRFTAVVYKGGGLLDLRTAEFSCRTTTITAVAYKSRLRILVPPGARIVARGMGVAVNNSCCDDAVPLPADAPVIRVRGYSYLGAVEATCRAGAG